MPCRPALPMNRARILGLGLSVGIAIALSGCADEIKAEHVTREIAKQGGIEGSMMRVALADGEASRGEVAVIIAESRSSGVLSRHKHTFDASGTEAQRAETTSGSVHDGPVPQADAQGGAQ